MSPTSIILTLAGYITLLFIVAWLAARNRGGGISFFTGGRNTHRIVAAIAMVGAAMSGVTYISVPGSVANDGFSYLQTTLGFFFGYVVIAYMLIPLYYRLGVVSLYEYLDQRFGIVAHRTGAWLFFLAKIMAASLRAFAVCAVLQPLLFERYDLPFVLNAVAMMLLVWLYTRRGGVRSVVWVEMLKTLIMVGSIVLCISFVIESLDINIVEAIGAIADSHYSDTLFFDDVLDRRYFFKQFVAGIFLVVAMTGLDQDMMQTALSCRSAGDAQRSLMHSIVIQMIVIVLFLALGALLYIFIDSRGLVVERGDELFGFVATECGLPVVVGILFLLGLVASTYSSAGSALTALTTTFTLDILRARERYREEQLSGVRKVVHALIAMAMVAIICAFYQWSSAGAITLIFTIASYTYGPLLGMFAFGLLTQRQVHGKAIPVIALLSPTISYIVASNSEAWLGGYSFSYEVLILNAGLCFVALWLCSHNETSKKS